MLRIICRTCRRCCMRLPRHRPLSSSSSNPENTLNNINNSHIVPIRQPYIFALSATLLSAIVAVISTRDNNNNNDDDDVAYTNKKGIKIYNEIENVVEKSNESVIKIMHRMKKTGLAASVLWKSLRSVMSSANHEVRVGFEIRVAALLADIAAASESRRAALVAAGGGAVVDWLLETVAMTSGGRVVGHRLNHLGLWLI